MNKLVQTISMAASLAVSALVSAQERPVVTVSFNLAVTRWQDNFSASQVADFQARSAEAVAQWLNREIGFFSFKPGTSPTRHINVQLAVAPDAGSKPTKETQLRLELVGHGPSTPLVWNFRPQNSFLQPTQGPEPFAREVQLRLIALDKQALVSQVLSHIPISNNAQMWKDPVGWVIPFRKAELCMDFQSILRVESLVESGAGRLPREFKARASNDFAPPNAAGVPEAFLGRLFSEAVAGQEGLGDLTTAKPEAVAIRAVYVLDYLPLQPCTGPLELKDVDFREGTQ